VKLMLHLIGQIFWRLLLVGILTIFIFLGFVSLTSQIATAALTQLQEASGETLYRSQRKLDDQSGKVWQVILFKQVYPGQPVSVNLRLVGFPGSVELIHPQPLKSTSARGQVWTAMDVFLDQAPAPTIAQYDLKDILPQLPNEKLTLGIPLTGENFLNISVPSSVVKEWRSVITANH
jgi:hypothetical protein